jgi:hypothetical protein
MEFKGTKGKWEIRKGVFGFDEGVTLISSNVDIAMVYQGTENVYEEEANALLISKAPEMLEMLKEIHSFLSSGTRINSDDIYQLIKEATEI